MTATQHCNHAGGYSKHAVFKLQPFIQSHMTTSQWICLEAENSAIVATVKHRAHLKMRHSASVHIKEIIKRLWILIIVSEAIGIL